MKKLYTLMAAAAATLAMNAQLYVTGGFTGQSWSPGTPMEVALNDNAYTFDLPGLTAFKISTAKGTWDEFNKGALTADISESNLGTPVALKTGDVNINAPWSGDYHVIVSGDLKTITMTTTTPKPTTVSIYLRGDMNAWGTPDDWKFTPAGDNLYKFEATGDHMIKAGQSFKIADAGWGNINYGGDAITADGTFIWNHSANNCSAPNGFEGDIIFTLPQQPRAAATVTFTTRSGVNDITVDNNAPAAYYTLQGVKVDDPAPGLYIVRRGNTVTKTIVR